MSRPLRIEYPGAFYHVMNRGHRREPIVVDARDNQKFISCLSRMAGQFNVLVHGYCLMTDREIPQLKELRPRPEVEEIIEDVAEHFKVTAESILERDRKRNAERAVAIYLSRELSGLSGQALGRHFGGVSGANITMRFNKVSRSLKKDKKLAKHIKSLRQKITNS